MTTEEIQNYWNERAHNSPATATTNDIWLRELETQTLAREIRLLEPAVVLDLGCGDAATTIRLALQFPFIEFIGADNATEMLDLAARSVEMARYKGNKLTNLKLIEGDVLEASTNTYDLAISCRCLINLENRDVQMLLLSRLAHKPYRLIENFTEPHDHLNQLRAGLGLKVIGINPCNTYLDKRTKSSPFADSYYFATRLIYSFECQYNGVKPDYDSDRHRLAVELPNVGELNVAPMRLICNL